MVMNSFGSRFVAVVFHCRAIAPINFISRTFVCHSQINYAVSVVLFLHVANTKSDGANQLAFGNLKNALFPFYLSLF